MRDSKLRDTALQCALAFLLLAPLLGAFLNGGGFADGAANQNPEVFAARGWTLLSAAGQSFIVGSLSVAIALVLGIPAAWALAGRRPSALRTACAILPLALPAPVAVSGWMRLIAPSAASSFALQLPGGLSATVLRGMLFSPLGAGLILGFSLWPAVALNVWPGFSRARDGSYEAARVYASPWRAFFCCVLPRCKSEIAAGAALVFLLSSNDFAVSSLLLVHTLPVQVHDQAALGKNAAAAWAALPLVVFAAALCAVTLPGFKNRTALVPGKTESNLRSGKFAAIVLFFGIALGFAIPMLACLRGVLASGKPLSVSFDAGAGSLGLSARLAAAAVLLACGIATARLLCWPEARARALDAAALLLLAIPGSFLGVALLTLQIKTAEYTAFSPPPLAWMALGFALRFLYVPVRLAGEAAAAVDPEMLESAALLGHNRIARAVSIVLPLALGHLAAAAALVFALALGEVPIAALLAPPGAAPATIWLFGQQHMGYDESVFALSLLLGAATAGSVALGALAAKWASR